MVDDLRDEVGTLESKLCTMIFTADEPVISVSVEIAEFFFGNWNVLE